jgi:hypothetical protein
MSIVCNAPYTQHASAAPQSTPLEGRYQSWELLPNMRLGTFAKYRDNNEKAFASLDGLHLCHHGECASSIRAWRCHEKKGTIKSRWSTCTCTRTEGLQGVVKMERLPVRPASYFDVLSDNGADRMSIANEPDVTALATPLCCDEGPIYLANDGRFFCSHGKPFEIRQMPKPTRRNAYRVLDSPIKKQKPIRRRFEIKSCGCKLVLPNRPSFPEVPLTPNTDLSESID